jgi:hypothetical protein
MPRRRLHARHRVVEQPLVRGFGSWVRVTQVELDVFAEETVTGLLRPRPDRDHQLRVELEPQVVGLMR